MNHKLRLAAFLFFFVVCAVCTSQAAPVTMPAAAALIHLDAENGQLTGAKLLTKREGFLGRGYVSGLTGDGDNIKWTLNAASAGVYEVKLRYSSPFGPKETELVVNGETMAAKLAATKEVFQTISLGEVRLKAGENSVTMNKGWGYYDVDALDFVPAAIAATSPASGEGEGGNLHLEAEDAQLTGAEIKTARAGFSGAGYVSGFAADGANIRWNLPVENAGIYEVRARYSSPNGDKGTEIIVNGAVTAGTLPATEDVFATVSLGKVELKKGDNLIGINKGWGYYDIDALDLVAAGDVAALVRPPAILSDARATPAARELMRYLVGQYGEKTLSGQYEKADNDLLVQQTGVTPAVFGGDLMDYSPGRVELGAVSGNRVEEYIERARDGQILTLSWHWGAPSHLIQFDKDGKEIPNYWWGGFYSEKTTFDVEAALANPSGENYKLLMRDIDAIAVELKKFDAAGIPILWRPLHETEGGWFWWGAKGAEPSKKLWRILYDRLTVKHDLHNLIWVYTTDGKEGWYPGDDVVDMVGADAYPKDVSDPLTSIWQTLNQKHGGKKLIALSEVGGVPDIEKMKRFGVRWSYFASWSGREGPEKMKSQAAVKALYNAPDVLNKAELPEGISD